MRTIWILPGWFGFIIGSSPSGYQQSDLSSQVKTHAMTAVQVIKLWRQRWRQRLDLEEMPDHLLKDMGLDRLDARREAAKPFWR